MLSWLIDNPITVLILLGIVDLGLLFGLWQTRQRRYAFAAGGVTAAGLLGWLLLLLLGSWFASDEAKIKRAVEAMRTGVRRGSTDAIFEHIARDFRIGGLDRNGFRQVTDRALRNGDVDDVVVWDYEPAEVKHSPVSDTGTATITFKVKPKNARGDLNFFGSCTATFVLEDGQWRMKTFEVRDPINNQPMQIPNVR